jgi:hypothetical protein
MSRLTVDDNFYSNAAHFCAALRKNTRICNLYCQAWFPADVLGQYLATAPRLSTIILELYHYEDTKSCESLLNGLVLNKTMRKVDLIHGSQQHSIWLDWLHHLLNHVTMEWFSVLERNEHHDYGRLRVFVSSIASLPSAIKRVHVDGPRNVELGMKFLLQHLGQGLVLVDTPQLDGVRWRHGPLPDDLFTLLQLSATRVETLQLTRFNISMNGWILLRGALASNHAVTTLELSSCNLDSETVTDFVYSIGSVVSHLCLDCCRGWSNRFGKLTLARLVATLLVAKDNPLRCLKFKGLRECDPILGDWESAVSETLVDELHLDSLGTIDAAALAKNLQNCTKLRVLTIEATHDMDMDAPLRALWHAVCLNGSLHTIKINRKFRKPFAKTSLDAFGHRNQCLPALLSSIGLMDGPAASVVLVPHFLRIAQQTTHMAPSSILLGLLAAGPSVGNVIAG